MNEVNAKIFDFALAFDYAKIIDFAKVFVIVSQSLGEPGFLPNAKFKAVVFVFKTLGKVSL